MSSHSVLILNQLDELVMDDFKRFKMHLREGMAQGFSPIPRSRLEKAEQGDVVDLMVNQYGPQHAAEITVQLLKQIRQNNLASKLERKLAGFTSPGQVPSAEVSATPSSSSSSSSSAPGFSQSIKAAESSNVYTTVLSGGIYNGPVTINQTSSQK